MPGLLSLLTLIIVLLIIIFGLGYILPRKYHFEAEAIYDESPEKLWRVINSHLREKDWRSDLFAVDRMPAKDGKMVWRETRRDQKHLDFVTEVSTPPKLLVRQSIDNNSYQERRQVELSGEGKSTRAVVSHHIELFKPLARFQFFFGQRKNNLSRIYLTDLKHYLISLAGEGEEEES